MPEEKITEKNFAEEPVAEDMTTAEAGSEEALTAEATSAETVSSEITAEGFWAEISPQRESLTLPDPEEKRGLKYVLRDIFSVLISAIVIAVALKAFVLDSRIVPSTSMYPTIDAGDRVIILKLPYFFGSTPERRDVVVFTPGEEFESDDDLLKRVIGLPGDTVEVKDNKVFVNGEALVEPYQNAAPNYIFSAVKVPEGCYFMMGDNRNNSRDSHLWEDPFVPMEDIKGQVVLCYWPLNHFGTIK